MASSKLHVQNDQNGKQFFLAFLKKWWPYLLASAVLGFLLGYFNGLVSSLI
nr:hypothetical protein [Candidatus Sigynarchaeota archaeon]